MEHCVTCELIERRAAGKSPLWDDIYHTPYWTVVHSFNTSLPGWLPLICNRHIGAIDEMTAAEAADLGLLLRRVSIALREAVGCTKTYVAQFAEAAGHQHVHFHVVPRMADQPDDHRGPNIFKYLGASEADRVSETRMNEVATVIRRILVAQDAVADQQTT